MLRFITGGAGTDKTSYIIKEIICLLKSNKKVILLVPEQQAVITENKFESFAKDVPTINLEILNFKRLCNRVFREYGGLAYNFTGKGVRNLILWDILKKCKPDFKEFNSIVNFDENFISVISETISEFNNYNISSQKLNLLSENISINNKRLSEKLLDTALIYKMYESTMKEKYNVIVDELQRLSLLLENNEFFIDTYVYIDSFNGFTQVEYEILNKIIKQAVDVNITIACDLNDNRPIFDNIKKMYNDLLLMTEKGESNIINLTENDYNINDEIRFLSDNIWKYNYFDSPYPFKPKNIFAVECGNIYEEAEFTAKNIIKIIRNGSRYRDICVIMRDVSLYQGIINVVFEKYEIPYFLSVRVELNSKPLIKLIKSTFDIISGYWRLNDIITYIKTGLVDISFDECDILETYVKTWNINGTRWIDDKRWTLNPAGYTDKMTDYDRETLDIVNELKNKIKQPLIKFSEVFHNDEHNVKKIAESFYNLLINLDIPKKLYEKSEENRQFWNSFVTALDQLVMVSGDLVVNADEFLNLLMIIINETNIGKIPASIDEVIIGNAGKSRIGDVDHVFILGLNDGIFPKNEKIYGIFTEIERKILEKNNVNLPNVQIYDEYLSFYNSAVIAKKSLTLICSSSDLNGNKQNYSPIYEQIMELFPALQPIKYSKLYPESLIEGFHASFDYTQIYKNLSIGKALIKIYSEYDEYLNRLYSMAIPLSQKDYKISDEIISNIYGNEIIMTQSRIDNYVMCKFSYCCKYLLRLVEKRQAIFRSADIGNFIHRILELYLSRYYNGVDHDYLPNDSDIMNLLEEIIDEYRLSMIGGFDILNIKFDHTIERLKKSLFLLIKNLHEEFFQSDFIPKFFEESITISSKSGEKIAAPYKIQLDNGKIMYITGIIDRIDTYTNGNKIYLRVVDYKTGIKDFSFEDIKIGLNLQMLLYLFTLWKNPTKKLINSIGGNEILPAGVLYFSARVPDITLKNEDDKNIVIELANDQLKRKGVLLNDEKILRAMEKNLEGKFIPIKTNSSGINKNSEKSLLTLDEFDELMNEINNRIAYIGKEINDGNMSAVPLKTSRHDACEYCPNKPICRREF